MQAQPIIDRSGANPYEPRFLRVHRKIRELPDVVTFEIDDSAAPRPWTPGQFNMLYLFGAGEVAISVSGDPAKAGVLTHTVRAVGAVTAPLCSVKPGAMLGVRGPFGRGWPLARARARKATIVLLAGGLGLAPLRPVIYHFIRNRADFERLIVLYGARSADNLLYHRELEKWRSVSGIELGVIVDRATPSWSGRVGVLTDLLTGVRFDPSRTIAMVCGPEIMMRVTARALLERGVGAEDIFLSMERNMKCAVGTCGHCQFGPHFVCKDGPVFTMAEIGPLLGVREL